MGLDTFSEGQFHLLRTGATNPLTGANVAVKGTIEEPKTIAGVQIEKSTNELVLCDSDVSLKVQKDTHYILNSADLELRRVVDVQGKNITLERGFTTPIAVAEDLKVVEGGRFKRVKITNTHATVAATVNGVSLRAGESIEREFARGCAPIYYDATTSELLFELSE